MIIQLADHNQMLAVLEELHLKNRKVLSKCVISWGGNRGGPWCISGIPDELCDGTMLKRYAGKRIKGVPGNLQNSKARDFWTRVRLVENRRAFSETFLVFSSIDEPNAMTGILDDLSTVTNLENVELVMLAESESDTPWAAYRVTLRRENRRREVVAWPPDAVIYAASWYRSDIYLPLGMQHPLLERHEFMLPQQKEGRLSLLRLKGDGSKGWSLTTLSEVSSANVVGQLALSKPAEKASLSRVTGAGDVVVPLQITDTFDSGHQLDQGDIVFYRFEGREGKLGDQFLSILDHAEAGIADFVYYSNYQQSDPWAASSHYIRLTRHAPGLHVTPEFASCSYYQPRAFRDHGLAVFLATDIRFMPDLANLLGDDQASADFVEKFRTLLGFTQDWEAVLIEKGEQPTRPSITLLKDGQPLKDMLSPLLRAWNPSVHLMSCNESRAQRTASAADTWEETIQRITTAHQEVQREADEWARETDAFCNDVAKNLEKTRRDGETAQGFLKDSHEKLAKSAENWKAFSKIVWARNEMLNRLHLNWLESLKKEKKQLSDATQNRLNSLASPRQTANQLLNDLGGELKQCQQQVNGLKRMSESAMQSVKKLETISERRSQAHEEGALKLAQLKAQMETHRNKLADTEDSLRAEKKALDQGREDLRRKEDELNSLRDSNETERKRQAEKRKSLQDAIRAAEQEARKLETVRDKELPQLREKCRAARNRLATYDRKQMDQELKAMNSEYRSLQRKLRPRAKRLKRLEKAREQNQKIREREACIHDQLERLGREGDPTGSSDPSIAHVASPGRLLSSSLSGLFLGLRLMFSGIGGRKPRRRS